jgi:hypothetical protein
VDQGVFLGLETRQGLYPSSLATWRSLAVHVYMYICDAWRTPRHHPCFLIVPASSSFFRSGLAWLSLSLAKLARDQPAVLSLPTPTEPPHLYASLLLLLDLHCSFCSLRRACLTVEVALRGGQDDRLLGQPQRHADGYVSTAYAHGTPVDE